MSADSRRTSEGDGTRPMSRLEELLADRAVQPLTAEEQRELERLLAAAGRVDADEFDRAAAAIELALGVRRKLEPLPAALRERIATSASLSATQFRSAHHRAIADSARAARPSLSPMPRSTFILWSGWAAAAAAILLTIFIAQVARRSDRLGTQSPGVPGATGATGATGAAVAAAKDKLSLPWKPTDDPDGKNVRGEIVWSDALQAGFMHFTGLPKNDPAQHQYQLWIFDSNQDDRYPIDGGVFDIASANGEAIVPIQAKLKVKWPRMFAVTEEKPGGVVVSAREHLVALAQI